MNIHPTFQEILAAHFPGVKPTEDTDERDERG